MTLLHDIPRHAVRGTALSALGLAWLLSMIGGCAVGDRPAAGGVVIRIDRPLRIPPNSAHTSFQGGRQVPGTSKLDPYCEMEIETVSGEPQRVQPGLYQVSAERYSLLRDPTTRLPALIFGFSCSDAVYQESLWLVRARSGGNLHSLRCIRPLFNCNMAPPLNLGEAELVTGSAFALLPADAGDSDQTAAPSLHAGAAR